MGVDLGSRRIDYIAGFIACRALVLASDEVLQFLTATLPLLVQIILQTLNLKLGFR